jgi:hypothetical protein
VRRFPVALTLRVGSVATLLALAAAIAPAGVVAAGATTPQQVSATPAVGTPRLAASSTATEVIKQLVPCGSQMYAVGSFPSVIGKNSQVLTRPDAFSFSAADPYPISPFELSFDLAPTPNETAPVINTIAFDGGDCTHAYIGGNFKVTGSSVMDIAEVDTATGALVAGFGGTGASIARGVVNTIVDWNGHLLVGGQFSDIDDHSGKTPGAYFASLNPATGLNDHYIASATAGDALLLAGHYSYTDQAGKTTVSNATAVTNQQISPDGTRDLVEGDFMTIGGQARQQVAMIDLGSTAATLDGWNAPEFNAYCNFVAPDYAQAAAWSPDNNTVYFADSGYKPSMDPGYDATHPTDSPRAGLCDSASSFPATHNATVQHNWINYTGCDSLYSVATDGTNLYFAGHERWVDNSNGCDGAGPGSIASEGIEGLSPADGSLVADPTRARGLGADDMLFTPAGLWIASDNYNGSASCGGVSGHAGLCLLPYTSTVTTPGPFAAVPAVTGKAAVGGTLTCAEGAQPTGVTTSYSWLLAGTAVSSSASYRIPAKDYRGSLTCQVTVSRTGSPSMSASAAPSTVAEGPALKAASAPELTHRPRVGHKVSARHGLWFPKPSSYTYQWYQAGKAVKGATRVQFSVRRGSKGLRLRCVVVAHATGYANGRATTQSWKIAAA